MPKFSENAFNNHKSLDLEKSSLDLEKPRRRNRVDDAPEYVNQFGERVNENGQRIDAYGRIIIQSPVQQQAAPVQVVVSQSQGMSQMQGQFQPGLIRHRLINPLTWLWIWLTCGLIVLYWLISPKHYITLF